MAASCACPSLHFRRVSFWTLALSHSHLRSVPALPQAAHKRTSTSPKRRQLIAIRHSVSAFRRWFLSRRVPPSAKIAVYRAGSPRRGRSALKSTAVLCSLPVGTRLSQTGSIIGHRLTSLALFAPLGAFRASASSSLGQIRQLLGSTELGSPSSSLGAPLSSATPPLSPAVLHSPLGATHPRFCTFRCFCPSHTSSLVLSHRLLPCTNSSSGPAHHPASKGNSGTNQESSPAGARDTLAPSPSHCL